MALSNLLVLGVLVIIIASCNFVAILASDPSPLQDLCVADPNSPGNYSIPSYWLSCLVLHLNESIITIKLNEEGVIKYILILGYPFISFYFYHLIHDWIYSYSLIRLVLI